MRFHLTLFVLVCAAVTARADDLVVLETGGLSRVSATDGSVRGTVPIKGLPDGERILAIDMRAKNGLLYGFSRKRLYTLEPVTGWAVPVGPAIDTVFPGGFRPEFPNLEFDPTADVARIAFSLESGRMGFLRIDADTGRELPPNRTDPSYPVFAYADGDPAAAFSLWGLAPAFTDNLPGAASTTLFGLDVSTGSLVRAIPTAADAEAGGAVTTIGEGTYPPGARLRGFEIAPDGAAWTLGETSGPGVQTFLSLFRIDLATGAPAIDWSVPGRLPADFAVAPTVPPPSIRLLDLTKVVARFNFVTRRRNSVELRGTLPPLPAWEGKPVRVSIARDSSPTHRINRDFVLDRRARGRSRGGRDSFAVVLDGNGVATSGARRFVLKLSRDVFHEFDIGATTPAHRNHLAVDLLVDGMPLVTAVHFDYTPSRNGKRGTATLVR